MHPCKTGIETVMPLIPFITPPVRLFAVHADNSAKCAEDVLSVDPEAVFADVLDIQPNPFIETQAIASGPELPVERHAWLHQQPLSLVAVILFNLPRHQLL